MKKLLPIALLASLALSACGSAPGQITGGGRASIGVAANDLGSSETATKTVTPATDKTPEKITWTVTPGKGVTFTFMTRPGSDAVYITGYRVVKQTLSTANGSTSTSYGPINKMDLYLTSGYTCANRSELHSCTPTDTGTTPDNGLPGTHGLYLENGLGDLVKATGSSVSRSTSLEFIGTTSNGKDVSVKIDNVISQGIRAGDI